MPVESIIPLATRTLQDWERLLEESDQTLEEARGMLSQGNEMLNTINNCFSTSNKIGVLLENTDNEIDRLREEIVRLDKKGEELKENQRLVLENASISKSYLEEYLIESEKKAYLLREVLSAEELNRWFESIENDYREEIILDSCSVFDNEVFEDEANEIYEQRSTEIMIEKIYTERLEDALEKEKTVGPRSRSIKKKNKN